MPSIYDFDVDFNIPVGHLLLFRPIFSISFDHPIPGTGHATISHSRIVFAFYLGAAAASFLVDLLPGTSISWRCVREQIARCLRSCSFPMEEGDRIRMINFALGNVDDFTRLSSGVMHVNVHAHMIGSRQRDEWEGIYRSMVPDDDWTEIEFGGDRFEFDIPADWIEDGEGDDRFMVPADGRAIESLDSRRVSSSSSNSGSCTICLEEFRDGEEAMCMPCSHDFHGDCIKEWLNNSHYCPVCRFEMPVGSSRVEDDQEGFFAEN